MVLKEDDQIVFVENFDPIAAKKLRWYQDPALRDYGVNLHPVLEAPKVTTHGPWDTSRSVPVAASVSPWERFIKRFAPPRS